MWRARELARKETRERDREREGLWKSGYWYAVSDFAVSRVGVKGEKRTPRDAVARRRVHTHTRARHARSACRPSHESKLFVTGENGQGQKEGGHTCLLTISGRSCRGSAIAFC